MGRKKLDKTIKKQTISIVIDEGIFNQLNLTIENKSQFINWLLRTHFNMFNR
jgi:hypothetical protein